MGLTLRRFDVGMLVFTVVCGFTVFALFGWKFVLSQPTFLGVVRLSVGTLLPLPIALFVFFLTEKGRGHPWVQPHRKEIIKATGLLIVTFIISFISLLYWESLGNNLTRSVLPFVVVSWMVCCTFVNFIKFHNAKLAGIFSGIVMGVCSYTVFMTY